MIAAALHGALPWRNPVFVRFWRSRLRLRRSVFWYLLTLIVTTFIVTLTYIVQTNTGTPPQDAARSLWIPLLIIQGLILMFKGTGSVAAGLIQDKIDQTLDYQRLTPVAPLRNLLGYLFGLPVLEYVMFALTLPHLAFVVVVGNVPVATLISVYFSFFVCVVLYHMTGIAAGMVMRRWIWGYMLSILLVLVVNVILPTFIAQLGLKFFQYLSVWPVIGQKVLPLIVPESAIAGVTSRNPYFATSGDVPFFNWTLSPFVFTLLLQGALIATFGTMAHRRWKSSTRHSLSKGYALGFLAGFIVVLIGNVWPIITRQYMPFALFGERNLENLGEVVAIGLPLVYVYVVWLLCIVLFSIVIPTHHSYVRGIRRAMKLGRPAARMLDDDAGTVSFYAIFTAVAVGGFAVLFNEISVAGFLEPFGEAEHFWRLPVVFALVLFYTALLLQALGGRPTVLVVLLLWFLPILAAIVVSAAQSNFGMAQSVIGSFSPIAVVFASGMLPLGAFEMGADRELSAALVGANVGLAVLVVQIAALWLHWNRRRREYDALCRAREESHSAEIDEKELRDVVEDVLGAAPEPVNEAARS